MTVSAHRNEALRSVKNLLEGGSRFFMAGKVAAVAEKQFVDQKKKGKGTKTGGRRGEKEGFNGLPRYLLTHLDNALRCKVGGVVSSRQAKVCHTSPVVVLWLLVTVTLVLSCNISRT